MEVSREALLKIVKSARLAIRTSKTMQSLMVEKGGWTWADEIAGQLSDALFHMSGERLAQEKDFDNDSMTMRLLTGEMSDGAVADWFLMMSKIRNRLSDEMVSDEYVTQPVPHTMTKDEFDALFKKNGGYKYTPEGKFR